MKIIYRGFALWSAAAIKLDIRVLNIYEFIKKITSNEEETRARSNPKIKFSSGRHQSEARERRILKIIDEIRGLNFRRITTEGSISHRYFLP